MTGSGTPRFLGYPDCRRLLTLIVAPSASQAWPAGDLHHRPGLPGAQPKGRPGHVGRLHGRAARQHHCDPHGRRGRLARPRMSHWVLVPILCANLPTLWKDWWAHQGSNLGPAD